MAPYLSLLPVRKSKLPTASGLPRLKPHLNSVNNAPPPPPAQPLEPIHNRVDQDASILDFGSLLSGQGEDEEFGLLNDEEIPDFLVDQSMWTVGGRTPARKGKEMATWDDIDEEEGEGENAQQFAQYDDSDGCLSPPAPGPSTPLPSTSSAPISFSPRPASTPSFRQSPVPAGQALFDEQEPSMNGNYTSNSNPSMSLGEAELTQDEDSTFTLERSRGDTPSFALNDAQNTVQEVEEVKVGEDESQTAEGIEANLEEIGINTSKVSEAMQEESVREASEDLMPAQTGELEVLEDQAEERSIASNAKSHEESRQGSEIGFEQQETVSQGEDVDTEASVPEVASEDVDVRDLEEEEKEAADDKEELVEPFLHQEAPADETEDDSLQPVLNDEDQTAESYEMETQVPVRFGDEVEHDLVQKDSSPSPREEVQDETEEEEEEDRLLSAQVPLDESAVLSSEAIPVEEEESPPRTELSQESPAADETKPKKAPSPRRVSSRPRPSFVSTSTLRDPTSKQGRHSMSASQPIRHLPAAHQRRQSIAAFKASAGWDAKEENGKGKGKELPQEIAIEETAVPADSNETSTSLESSTSLSPARPERSNPIQSPASPAIDFDIPRPISTTPPLENPLVSFRSSHPSHDQSNLSSHEHSLPLSPSDREPTSFDGDISLPLMGAPLEFQRTIGEIGHSTPAKSRPRQAFSLAQEIEGSNARVVQERRFEIETIEEVTEEESSFEIVRERSAEEGLGVAVKEEEEVEESDAQILSRIVEDVEAEEEQDQPLPIRHSSPPAAPEVEPLLVEPAVAQVSHHEEANSPLSPLPSEVERDETTSALPMPPSAPVNTKVSSHPRPSPPLAASLRLEQPQGCPPLPSKRSVRVSLAAPPPPPTAPRPKPTRRASTSVITSTSTLGLEAARKTKGGKPIRVSLAAPHSSTTTTRPRNSRTPLVPTPSLTTEVQRPSTQPSVTTDPIKEAQRDAPLPVSAPLEETQPVAIEQPLPVSERPIDDPGASPVLPAAALPEAETITTTQVESAALATSPTLPPAPLPASASSNKQAALTLPTTFSFGSTSTGLTREQERQKRKEERERREKRVAEALQAKKQSMQRGSGWKKPEVKKDSVKRKAVENDRNAKRVRTTAPSETGSSKSRQPALKVSTSSSKPSKPSQPPLRAEHSTTAPAERAPSPNPAPVPANSDPAPSNPSPVLKLTKATLEANRFAAGPRVDLKRRISSFLESLEEDEASHSELQTDLQQNSFDPEVERSIEESTSKDAGAIKVLPLRVPTPPPAPPPPPPPPIVARPPSRAQSDRPKPSTSRPVAAALKRKPLVASTTTAKPFTFAAPRGPRIVQPAPPSSNASTASPMFAERLSVWKAREKAAIGKGKRKAAVAPPPMPFKTKNDRPNPPARLANSISSSSTSAPLPKRPRIEPSTSEQGRGGKENGPFQRSEKPISKEPLVQKKPEKPALRIISGGVAEEMEKRLQEKLKWSERQKQREEEVRKRKEAQRSEEAYQERKKLQALRAALTAERRSGPTVPNVAGRSVPVRRV